MHFSDFDNDRLRAQLSGERFLVTYELFGTEADCRTAAEEICVEQSIEFPVSVVPDGEIPDQIVGRIEAFTHAGGDVWEAKISFCAETTGEFTQFLNVVFGNFSIKQHVRVAKIELSPSLYAFIKGPRFGIEGIRDILQEYEKPLLMTALKPMGLSAENFGSLMYTFAKSGIRIVKDDHGLANQKFAPFRERVKACCDAAKAAYEETGQKSLYVPNVTAPFAELRERALYAKECGAGGIMVAPGLTGLDAMKALAEDDEIALPVFSHPAFSGSNVVNRQGFSIPAYYGTVMRLAGADAVIFPNYGGRFSFTKEECLGIALAGKEPLQDLKTMIPCPSGGMQIDRIPGMLETYGNDICLLIGGGLFTCGPDLEQNCRDFAAAVG